MILLISLTGCIEHNQIQEHHQITSPGIHFSGCESARNREFISTPNGDQIDGWSNGRANPLLEVADIEIWHCEKIDVGNVTFLQKEFAIFYRFNQDPPENCLRITEKLPAVLQAILVESQDLQLALKNKLNFEKIFVGQISTPSPENYTEFSWSLDGRGGKLSGQIQVAEPYENRLRNEFFWQIGTGLGHLILEFSTTNKSSIGSISSGEISWPTTMVNPTGKWVGSAGYYADMRVASSIYEYSTHDCQEQRRLA